MTLWWVAIAVVGMLGGLVVGFSKSKDPVTLGSFLVALATAATASRLADHSPMQYPESPAVVALVGAVMLVCMAVGLYAGSAFRNWRAQTQNTHGMFGNTPW